MVTNKRGFTLIELLVVIAIIGILSGLIIVNLSGAQNAAKDAKIKADLDQIRAAAEVYKANNDYYAVTTARVDATTCDLATSFLLTNGDGDKACDDAVAQLAGNLLVNISTGTGTSATYCVSKLLNSGGTFCVDYTGYAGTLKTHCDAATNSCI